MLRNLLEGLVCGGEYGIVGLGAIERFDQVIVFVDELCELRGVLALVDELELNQSMPLKEWGYGVPRTLSGWAYHHAEDDGACRGGAGDEGGHGVHRSR